MRTVHQILATGARRLRLRAIRKQLAKYSAPHYGRVLFLHDFAGSEMKFLHAIQQYQSQRP